MFRFYVIILVMLLGISRSPDLYGQGNDVCIEKITVNYDSVLFDRHRDFLPDDIYILDNTANNLLIECSPPGEGYMFSFRLFGNDNIWSPWSGRPVKEYTNLKPGDYSLHIKVMMPGGEISEYDTGSFRIEQPFYLTTLAFILYTILLLLILFAIFRLLLSRHKSRQARLEAIIQERTEELMSEKERTENLLANLLPKDTADEIMSKGKATKQKYNFVTVLFSDIEGFTRIAEEVNPEELIDELDNFFFHFDSVVEKHNIEKIKTIGDAYMCAGGIPHRNRTNPLEVVLAALEMQEYMLSLKKEQTARGIKFWDIRIGIHTGTVIAGVVGQKKLSYDIWGDTVNTASRMESSGIAGKINISGVTYEYVKDFFICEYRGKMPVKYKGDLDMYFVKGIRPELREEGKNIPNKVFNNKLLNLKVQDLEDYYFEWYEANVPDDFSFHNVKFLKNICTQTELLATAEQLDEEIILGLRLASLFIKSGLTDDYNEPLEHSVEHLKKMAPQYGFGQPYIDHAEMIIRELYAMETARPEVQILMDAINDYRGHVDYPMVTELRYEEENSREGPLDRKKWYAEEREKIRNHDFFTATARLLKSYSGEEQAQNLERYTGHIE
ncbi:MAG: adenylate/guanylate cyclase domain-containing protein [Bacteroidales bacterium]|nr:adenylate/guanylate cyclase domain-containing protein [Bacteroidales bacterium]